MGNSLKKNVNKLRSKRLVGPPYLKKSVACPVCGMVFKPTDTNYLVFPFTYVI